MWGVKHKRIFGDIKRGIPAAAGMTNKERGWRCENGMTWQDRNVTVTVHDPQTTPNLSLNRHHHLLARVALCRLHYWPRHQLTLRVFLILPQLIFCPLRLILLINICLASVIYQICFRVHHRRHVISPIIFLCGVNYFNANAPKPGLLNLVEHGAFNYRLNVDRILYP